ncbi:MAG: hypothetical protein HOG34_02775 [Bacteroidetes bacterium]|nr:hypothetical protein [Bacteroidota bacterium]
MDHSNFSFRLILFISLTFYALNPLCAQVELVAKPNNGKQRKGVSSPWFYEFKDQVYFKGADNISPGLLFLLRIRKGHYIVVQQNVFDLCTRSFGAR